MHVMYSARDIPDRYTPSSHGHILSECRSIAVSLRSVLRRQSIAGCALKVGSADAVSRVVEAVLVDFVDLQDTSMNVPVCMHGRRFEDGNVRVPDCLLKGIYVWPDGE